MTDGLHADERASASPGTPMNPADGSLMLKRISWGSIFAGGFITLAIWLMLTLLGTGIGLSVAQPSAGETITNVGVSIGGGIWWVITGLIALVMGGYVAARLAGVIAAMDGVIHGVTTWAITMLFMLYLLTTAVGGVLGGVFNLIGGTASAAGQGLKTAVPSIEQASGLSSKQIESKVRDLLNSSPPPNPKQMTPQQAQAAVVKLVPQLISGGDQAKQARQRIVSIVAAQANISPEQANKKLDQWQQQLQSTEQQAKTTAKQTADQAASVAGTASLWGFAMLILGAGASALGGAIGIRSSLAEAWKIILRRQARDRNRPL